jgi:hypothetical protein
MSNDHPKRDTMSLEEATISNKGTKGGGSTAIQDKFVPRQIYFQPLDS